MTKESTNQWRPPRGKTPQEVDFLFMTNNLIGDKRGISLEAAMEQGLIPDLSLGSSALSATEGDIVQIEYPNEIEIHDPSVETVKNWVEEFEYRYTSDGTRWLCALDSNGQVFEKVEATSDIDANNTMMLLEKTQTTLNHFRGIKGQQSLGLEEPKDLAA